MHSIRCAFFGVDAEDTIVKIIAGLGNPGIRYAHTRHNAGFWVVDTLAVRWSIPCSQRKFSAMVGEGRIAGERVLLLKPETYMNRSGQAVAAAAHYFDVADEDILAIVDDLALDPGIIRIRSKGSAGGHNGLKDISLHLHSQQFPRLRLGIGSAPLGMDSADYVLSVPPGDERRLLQQAVEASADAVETWIRRGIQSAMAEYNRKKAEGNSDG